MTVYSRVKIKILCTIIKMSNSLAFTTVQPLLAKEGKSEHILITSLLLFRITLFSELRESRTVIVISEGGLIETNTPGDQCEYSLKS